MESDRGVGGVPLGAHGAKRNLSERVLALGPLAVLGLAYLATVVLMLLVSAAGHVLDRPVGDFTRDPTAVLEGPAYIGFVSSIGAVVWAVGATACLLAVLLLEGRTRSAFLWGGLLTAALLADDLFLLHETYYPQVGVPEKAVPLLYAVAIVAYAVVFRDFLRRHGLLLIPAAAALFAVSGLLDFTLDEEAPFLVEDGAKLLGIVTWTFFFTAAAVRELRGLRPAPAPSP
jgi:hypothetical protein